MDVKPAQISLKGCNELQTARAGPAELGGSAALPRQILPVPPRGADTGLLPRDLGLLWGFSALGWGRKRLGRGVFHPG